MMFWLATSGLVVLGSLFVVLPALIHRNSERRNVGNRTEANVTLYHERIAELREELASGAIDEGDYATLETELQRSLLRDSCSQLESLPLANDRENPTTTRPIGNTFEPAPVFGLSGISKLVPVLAMLIVPVLAYSLYDRWGYHDDVQLSGLFRQAIHPANNSDEITDLIAGLEQAVEQHPDNQWAWYFLGRSFSRIGKHGEAKRAFEEAIQYLDSEPDKLMAMSQFVLASFLSADRELNDEAKVMAERVLAINPNEQTVLRILATAAREREDFETAIDYWQRLVRANPSSSSARVYRSNIAAAQRVLEDSGATETAVAGSPQIKVQVALAASVDPDPGQRVFIAVRNAERQGIPPLAVAQLTVDELPTTVVLDNSAAVGPFNLSSAEKVVVSALVSKRGIANPQPGDFRVLSEPVSRGEGIMVVDLLIADEVF